MLKFEFSDADQHAKADSRRNCMVCKSHPYQGKFRKMRVEYQNLLSCLLTTQVSVSAAPAVVTHTRKEYSFLKPCMVHGNYTKKELIKFIGEAKIWLDRTITEEEKKDKCMIYASLRSRVSN